MLTNGKWDLIRKPQHLECMGALKAQLWNGVGRVIHGFRHIWHVFLQSPLLTFALTSYPICAVEIFMPANALLIFFIYFIVFRFCHPHFVSPDHDITLHDCTLLPTIICSL
jgi:hypothetical protein